MKQLVPNIIAPVRNRSCAYPARPLGECVELAQKIFDGLGPGPHTRAALAKGLGYSSFSGPASVRIGALVQFGLLERSRGVYSVTSSAREIFAYPEESSLPAIAAAAACPALYRKIIAKFSGGSLPRNLAAVLSAGYGITEKAAPDAARNFIQTMEFAGLARDGILESPRTDAAINHSKPEDKTVALPAVPENKDEARIKIELPCGAAALFPRSAAYRLSLGEFADEIKNLDRKIAGGFPE